MARIYRSFVFEFLKSIPNRSDTDSEGLINASINSYDENGVVRHHYTTTLYCLKSSLQCTLVYYCCAIADNRTPHGVLALEDHDSSFVTMCFAKV